MATARRDGDDYVLDGVKWHVTSYNDADYAFFQAKLTDGPHAGEHAMFLVDLPSPGVRVVRTPAYTHTISHHHPIVAFEGVRVPATQMVGSEGDGMGFAYEWFRFERIMVALACLGAAARLIEETTAFAKERIVNGKPITEFGAVQAMLADCADRAVRGPGDGLRDGPQHRRRRRPEGAAHPVLDGQALRLGDGQPGRRPCVQIFGGRGYMRENVAERFFRELRVERIWEGTSEVQRSIIAEQMVKRGPGPSSDGRPPIRPERTGQGTTWPSDGGGPGGRVPHRLTQVAAGDHGHELVDARPPPPAIGPGRGMGRGRPRCTEAQASQSCWLVMSQKFTAYDGSNPGSSRASGANAQVHSIRVESGPSGVNRWVMT